MSKKLFIVNRCCADRETGGTTHWFSYPISLDEAEKLRSIWEQLDYQPTKDEADSPYSPVNKNDPVTNKLEHVKINKYIPSPTEKDCKEETRTYSFTAEKRYLVELERLFKFMNACGSMGTSQEFTIFFDGDGSADVNIKRTSKPTESFDTIEIEEEVNDALDNEDDLEFIFE